MNTRLPELRSVKPQKRLKSISFEFVGTSGKFRRKTDLGEPQNTDEIESHGNDDEDETTNSFEDTIDLVEVVGKKFIANEQELVEETFSGKERRVLVSEEITQQKRSLVAKNKRTDDNVELRKLLREKDREVFRLQEVVRKMSLDRETAVCANATSRMRVAELKNKLSNQHRKVEQVTTIERLRSKEKVSSETERLRHERDEARVQLAHHEKLVWQLRKQLEQEGYVSRQRYKTIQELGRKMAVKDKNLQDMRKRMEQAQLITVSGSSSAERRGSICDPAPRNLTWEGASRLTTVNE